MLLDRKLLKTRTNVFGLQNVEIVKGGADNPKLPPDRLAAVLVVDTYHHFEYVERMLDHILHALKPGGRMVIAITAGARIGVASERTNSGGTKSTPVSSGTRWSKPVSGSSVATSSF